MLAMHAGAVVCVMSHLVIISVCVWSFLHGCRGGPMVRVAFSADFRWVCDDPKGGLVYVAYLWIEVIGRCCIVRWHLLNNAEFLR